MGNVYGNVHGHIGLAAREKSTLLSFCLFISKVLAGSPPFLLHHETTRKTGLCYGMQWKECQSMRCVALLLLRVFLSAGCCEGFPCCCSRYRRADLSCGNGMGSDE